MVLRTYERSDGMRFTRLLPLNSARNAMAFQPDDPLVRLNPFPSRRRRGLRSEWFLAPSFCFSKRRRVGNRLIGYSKRLGDLDNLVAARQQPQYFEFARRHLRRRTGADRRSRESHGFARCGVMKFSPAATFLTAFTTGADRHLSIHSLARPLPAAARCSSSDPSIKIDEASDEKSGIARASEAADGDVMTSPAGPFRFEPDAADRKDDPRENHHVQHE